MEGIKHDIEIKLDGIGGWLLNRFAGAIYC